jgi:hypothetical protein
MRWAILPALVLGAALPARGQSRIDAGGAIGLSHDLQTPTETRVGGTTWSGTVVFGADVSRHLGVEVEAAFSGDIDAEPYVYNPSPKSGVEVETRGRSTFLSAQLRARAGVVEPVVGLGYVRATLSRHAAFTSTGGAYFDDSRIDHGIALVTGIDVASPISPRVAIVPTLRVYFVDRGSPPAFGNTATAGPVVLRAGVGVRVHF